MEGQTLDLAQRLEVAEEEGPVLANGAADRKPKLVAAVFRPARGVSISRIQFVVAQEFVHRSVNLVRSRLDEEINRGTGRLAEGRVVDVGLHLEFLDRVRRRRDGKAAKGQVAGVHAVNQRVVAGGARTVGGVARLAEGRAERLRSKSAVVGGRAGDEDSERTEPAQVQRQLHNLALPDHGAHARGTGRDQRPRSVYLD